MRETRKTLKKKGIFFTRQRQAILKELRGRYDHPDVDTLYESLKDEVEGLSLDTVYRSLSLFEKHGLIQKLALPGTAAHFDGNAVPHDHFVCLECDRILDVDAPGASYDCLPESLPGVATVVAVQRVFFGVCARCDTGK